MIRVSCAIIVNNGKFLATRRLQGDEHEGLWEFPGGKLEADESAEQSIVREIEEELKVKIRIIKPLKAIEHQYPHKEPIVLYPFICEITSGEIFLTAHSEACWMDIQQTSKFAWAEADLKILDLLRDIPELLYSGSSGNL